MDAGFWHQKWQKNEIGFHQSDADAQLVKHFSQLQLQAGDRVFLPLCGKTLDIAWMLDRGYQVAGAELSGMAIEQLFANLRIKPQVTIAGFLKRYSGDNIDIFVGDIFELTAQELGAIDAVYDRAALVALPAETRKKYTRHLAAITSKAPQLLLCFEYDQSLMAGPPFSISQDEVKEHYAATFETILLEHELLPQRVKGKVEAIGSVWHLK
ncbi:MAG: thiopurine S-methyltransferase [Parvibaculaceae bacterium]|nr:thiopurine S-methyltransferase [Parvibaculaceae bacterium]